MTTENLDTDPTNEFGGVTAEVLGQFVQICEKDTDGLHVMLSMREAGMLKDWLSKVTP